MPDAKIRRLVRQGVLVPVGHGAYVRAKDVSEDPAADHALRLAAVLATARPGPAGSHRSAAVIHGLDLLTPWQPGGAITVTRPVGLGSGTGRAGVHVHVAALPGEHVTVRGGVRVTSVARTVVDLARTSPFRDGVVVADSALRNGQTSKDELLAVVAACAKWPGIRRARMVVDFCDAALRQAGFQVVHFTWYEINKVPHQVAASIWEAFRRGERQEHTGG